jgi:hypothetical protein
MVVNVLSFGPSPTSRIEIQYADITLANNQSAPANVDASLSFAVGTYGGFQAEYYITDASSPSIVRMGKLSCVINSDGSIPSITDMNNISADVGISFSLMYDGSSTANLQFTSTNTSTRTMRVLIHRFLR